MSDTELILQYNSLGYSDAKIAKLLNRSTTYVEDRRNELGLSTVYKQKRLKILEKIKELSNLKLSDKEMGKILGKNYRTISYYRKLINLKPSMPENTYNTKTDRIKGYMIRNSKYMAKRRNIPFDLHYSDITLTKNCPILGIELTFGSESDGNCPSHATLDRIDNSKGYVKGNVIVISRLANSMKNSANFQEIKTFCSNILLLITFYENQGALGNITDIFPDIKLYQET